MTRKACLVGPAYPYRGGIAHSTGLLAREFAKDHEVLVINFKRLYPSVLFPGRTQFDESRSPFPAESERIIDSIDPFSYWRAAGRIAKFEPDIVVFQWWHPFFAPAYLTISFRLARLMKRARDRTVFICHNVLPHESSPLDRMLIRAAFGCPGAFVVHSGEDRDNLLSIRKTAAVEVNPLPAFDMFNRGGFTRESARRSLGVDGPVVLFFGLVRAYKGLGVLLEAFAQTLRRAPATLLVVGEFYEPKERYTARIKELGIGERVIVVDRYVPDEEVEKYFMACDVVALPYLSATQSAIVQVAFSFGRPVIVTSVGGLPEVVDDGSTGYVVAPNDVEALAEAITKFFERADRDAMSRSIAAAKDRFSWERCKRVIVGLVDDPGRSRRAEENPTPEASRQGNRK
jgi:glycosyltransferase involved in cell wall biosynthesis